jgi:immunoglobulin-binding protein 1
MSNLPLPQYYAKTLQSLLPISNDTLSPTSPQAKSLLSTSLDDLHLIHRMITTLSLFSANESLEELGDGELVFMTVLWVLGECESKGGLDGFDSRKQCLKRSEVGVYCIEENGLMGVGRV